MFIKKIYRYMIEIYLDDQKLDMENILVTNFNEIIAMNKHLFSKTEIDFSSIHYLKGNKDLLELAFQHQKKESIEQYG
jgi:hypothetical protein